jgi:CheY-like chemotaxis protein
MAHILVIDDEHNIRTMIRLALQHVGHAVETAADGEEGLDRFGEGTGWDLVLLDQRMPGLEGLDVLRQIRHRAPDARVIMITAFGTIDLAVDAMKSGAQDFLRKPFTAETLRGAVQSVLQGLSGTSGSGAPTFGMTTINGYRIESQVGPALNINGDMGFAFTVRSPAGEVQQCTVVLSSVVAELVKAHADRDQMPGGSRFWQALCEEGLANYLWQNAAFPPDRLLRLDDLTTSLRRWTDAVLATE